MLQLCADADSVDDSVDESVDESAAADLPSWNALELSVRQIAMDADGLKLLGYIAHSRIVQLVEVS